MTRIEIYPNADKLKIYVFKGNSKNYQYIKSVDSYDFVRKLYNSKVLGIKDNDKDADTEIEAAVPDTEELK